MQKHSRSKQKSIPVGDLSHGMSLDYPIRLQESLHPSYREAKMVPLSH